MKRLAPPALYTSILLTLLAACAQTPVKQESSAPTGREKMAVPASAPREVKERWTTNEGTVDRKDGRLRSAAALPTGHVDTSVLLLERDLPAEIVGGQEFSYDLKVTSIGHTSVRDVTLREDCATEWDFVRADPAPTQKTGGLVWKLGELGIGDARVVRVTGKARGSSSFTSCASLTYDTTLCLTAPVVNPALSLSIAATREATPCDEIEVRLTVANSGTGTLRDVRVAYPLPEGWTTAERKTAAQFAVDALDAGETREFKVLAKSARVGDFSSRATATAAPSLKAESAAVSTVVRQAVLAMKAEATEHVHRGQPGTFTFSVTNQGTAPAGSATIEARVPANARFLKASDGGAMKDGVVVWTLAPIAVKAARSVSMTIEAGEKGPFVASATAKAYCAEPAVAEARIPLLEVPALLLEVTDLVDPVILGNETTYEIAITNQGTGPATNVKIVAGLEANEQFLSATGASTTIPSPGTVAFDPIATIAPKAKVTLRLTVKCVAAGDTRFKISMTADQISRPVEETESTQIYN